MAQPAPRSDTGNFESLFAPELDRAYGVALRLTRNGADAEDLVQEAALLAFRGFATYQQGTNFRAWFMRILMNAFLSSKRRKRPEDDAASLDDELPNAFIQRQASGAELSLAVIGGLEAEEVQRAVDALPEEFRTAAALYFIQDMSYQEIAVALGIPIGTVRSRLHRGRALLQKRLWKLAQDHGIAPRATEHA